MLTDIINKFRSLFRHREPAPEGTPAEGPAEPSEATASETRVIRIVHEDDSTAYDPDVMLADTVVIPPVREEAAPDGESFPGEEAAPDPMFADTVVIPPVREEAAPDGESFPGEETAPDPMLADTVVIPPVREEAAPDPILTDTVVIPPVREEAAPDPMLADTVVIPHVGEEDAPKEGAEDVKNIVREAHSAADNEPRANDFTVNAADTVVIPVVTVDQENLHPAFSAAAEGSGSRPAAAQEELVPYYGNAPFVSPEEDAPTVSSGKKTAEKKKQRPRREKKDDDGGRILRSRKSARPFVLAVIFNTLKILAVLVVLIGIGIFGLVMGVAKAYVDTTPSLDISGLTRSERTSYIYDRNGNLITTFAGMEYRDWVDIEDIPDMLKNALISIEDVRFYKHGGVDFKRLFSAVVNTFRNQNTHGGSTLTQQLIKNKILSNEQSYKRKIQEAYLSYELEHTISKDDILEAYMNDVFLGESNYGFAAAAKDYFGKELSQLTVRECAMLAGMVQKPYYTNPRANTYSRFYEDGRNKMDVTDKRTDMVLTAMYDAGFITTEQYNAALRETVTIIEKSEKSKLYDMPYFVEYAVYDIITHLLEQRGLEDTKSNRSAIETELRTGGYHIYLTVDPEIQNLVQQTIIDWTDYPELKNPSAGVQVTTNSDGTTMEIVQPQAATVILDHHTGELLAVIGGRQEPTLKKQLNRAYQSSMPVGSSIKPLSVYGPALDLGLSCCSTVLNAEIPIPGYGGTKGYPALGSSSHMGMQTLRRGVEKSLNIVAARTLFDHVTPRVGAEYLEKLGVKSSRINVDGPGLALGTTGITPIEMAGAYATIANGGMYLEPLSFSVVLDRNMNVVLDADKVRKSYRVFEESSAYMLIDMLKDVVKSGTGKRAAIDGVTVAGKTGTNDDYTSVYFAGFTGYYTCALWIGHDLYAEKLAHGSTGGNSAAPLWHEYMAAIHEGLPDRPIMDVSPGDIGLTRATLCRVSGKLATDACKHDENNPPVTDWIRADQVPAEYCDMHCMVDYCTESEMPASAFCPAECRYEKSILLIAPGSYFASFVDYVPGEGYSGPYAGIFAAVFPNAVITDVDAANYYSSCIQQGTICAIHSATVPTYGFNTLAELKAAANELIEQVDHYLLSVQTLPDTDRQNLVSKLSTLQFVLLTDDYQLIGAAYEELKTNYTYLSFIYPAPIPGG